MLFFVVTGFLTACGYRGALYLPENPTDTKVGEEPAVTTNVERQTVSQIENSTQQNP